MRLGGIYGTGRDMVSMIKQAAGEQIPKNGNDVPAWSGIFDITNGVSFAFNNQLVGTYNLVDDMQLSRRELSNEICDIDGLPPVIWANENSPGARTMNAKVSNEKIKLEQGRLIKERSWEEFRSFVVLEVETDQHNSNQFCFQSKGKRFYFGSFLNEEDKLILKNELKRIINQLNALSPGL